MVDVALDATQSDDPEQRSTPKGRRRRRELVAAAAELLVEGGFEAVRHRAVAHRADAPLSATTYYFESLDELREQAVDHGGALDVAALRGRLTPAPDRRAAHTIGREGTVELLVDLLMGDGGDVDRLAVLARYERFLAPVRYPHLREVQSRLRGDYEQLIACVLEYAGRPVAGAGLARVLAVVDGAILAAVVDTDGDPRECARRILNETIDLVAPERSAPARGAGPTDTPEHDRR
ncbi:TetR/AcrR family transcriptional regulator [Millisia brevis]|uniref:TetR/AcrR family transcriptional regulator n=1 Tax=Millisia brevis TaxID=264148 RepID=UPI0009FCC6F3|nr:TetR family transcriptional regulator [Millisia brevis]